MSTLILVPDGDPFAVNLLAHYRTQAMEIPRPTKNFTAQMP